MSKKLKFIIKDKTTLILDEEGKKGDLIDLNEAISIDQDVIINQIKNKQDEIYNKYLENERLSFLKDQEIREVKLKNDFNDQLNKLENKYNDEIIKLKNEINNATLKKELELKEAIYKVEKEYEHKLNLNNQKEKELMNDLNLINERHQNEVNKITNDFNLKISQFEINKIKELSELETELANIKREKSTRSIQKIGSELETWCEEEFKNASLYGFKNSSFIKDTEIIDSTKGDYVFKVFSQSDKNIIITSAMLEMKSESTAGKTKQKNSDHYKKLDDDRKKKRLEYAILVSELEYHNETDAPIFLVPDYEKMFVVRPPFFLTLLGIIETIGLKYEEIISKEVKKEITFKEARLILDEFNSFKDDIIDMQIRLINNKLIEIQSSADSIISHANKIIDANNVITNTHLRTIINKITNFNITKNIIEKI